MHKLLTGIAATAALALFASASLACPFHETTASAAKEEVVAMSTPATPVVVTTPATVEAVTASECPVGATDCTPTDK